MTRFDFEFLCQLLKERSGLALSPEKEYLVDNRLTPVARRNGFKNVAELVQRLRQSGTDGLKAEVTEAMMNNESYFFRDRIPFDLLRETVLPDLRTKRALRRKLRIWCAAASTGQEPYSVAMLLDEQPELANWDIELVATDISSEALDRGRAGLYSQFEVQRGLPIQLLMQHFSKAGDQWQIAERLRSPIRFQKLNLLQDFTHLGLFDLVLCRNVLIYFDHTTKLDVLARLRRAMADDGYLILGAAETMVGLGEIFKPTADKRALYQPRFPAPRTPSFEVIEGGARVA